MYKVIFHIDEEAKWQLTLDNARNFLAAEKDAVIEILANSAAVTFLSAEAAQNEHFTTLTAAGVRFAACRNGLNKLGITPDQLPQAVEIVPAGVVELAARQQEGYAYIKP